jgi:hypothetical protein
MGRGGTCARRWCGGDVAAVVAHEPARCVDLGQLERARPGGHLEAPGHVGLRDEGFVVPAGSVVGARKRDNEPPGWMVDGATACGQGAPVRRRSGPARRHGEGAGRQVEVDGVVGVAAEDPAARRDEQAIEAHVAADEGAAVDFGDVVHAPLQSGRVARPRSSGWQISGFTRSVPVIRSRLWTRTMTLPAYDATLPGLAWNSSMIRALRPLLSASAIGLPRPGGSTWCLGLRRRWPGEDTQRGLGHGVQARFVHVGLAEGLLDYALRKDLGPVLAVRGSEDGPAICRCLTREGT